MKTSSLGDVIHMLPAITEAKKHIPELSFDWVVEKNFAEIASWHSAVEDVIPVEIRKWRKNIFKSFREIRAFKRRLKAHRYDYVIDAQGLLKSAWVTLGTKGVKYGFDRSSAREPMASWVYKRKIHVEKGIHALVRLKKLVASVFSYQPECTQFDYGIKYRWQRDTCQNQVIFLHSTTWPSKFWCLSHWQELAKHFDDNGVRVLLPWGNDKEKENAQKIAQNLQYAEVLPKLSLTELAELFANSKAVVAVDTGLSHLAAACEVPTVGIYGATSAKLTGAKGKHAEHIASSLTCSPCLKRICPITKEEFAPCEVSISALSVYQKVERLLQSIN